MPHQLDSAMMAAQAANKQSAAKDTATPFTHLAQKTCLASATTAHGNANRKGSQQGPDIKPLTHQSGYQKHLAKRPNAPDSTQKQMCPAPFKSAGHIKKPRIRKAP